MPFYFNGGRSGKECHCELSESIGTRRDIACIERSENTLVSRSPERSEGEAKTSHKECITRIIGLMSGTSHDGVDAALVEIRIGMGGGRGRVRLIKHLHICYPKSLRDEIRRAFNGNTELICRLNFRLGDVFAKAVLSLLKTTGFRPGDIDAVASHGQTIYHCPPSGKRPGATLQIGEASVIAERTGILTISDFRAADMAAGGHGAPLVPMADYILFRRDGKVIAVLNIGGIANVTIIREKIDDTIAFDTGPGNSLIDEAMRFYSKGKISLDRNGSFARSGRPVKRFLDELLSHPYFKKRPPKSTGRETFGIDMVKDIFKKYSSLPPHDIVSTLTYLTAITIHDSIIRYKPDEVILTGGGVKNKFLVELIKDTFKVKGITVNDISIYGIKPQAKEAVSFAILGYLTLNHRHGNIPSATGARHGVILGKMTLPRVFIHL